MTDLSYPRKTPADLRLQADNRIGTSSLHQESRLSGISPFPDVSASFAPLCVGITQEKKGGFPIEEASRIFFLFRLGL